MSDLIAYEFVGVSISINNSIEHASILNNHAAGFAKVSSSQFIGICTIVYLLKKHVLTHLPLCHTYRLSMHYYHQFFLFETYFGSCCFCFFLLKNGLRLFLRGQVPSHSKFNKSRPTNSSKPVLIILFQQ